MIKAFGLLAGCFFVLAFPLYEPSEKGGSLITGGLRVQNQRFFLKWGYQGFSVQLYLSGMVATGGHSWF